MRKKKAAAANNVDLADAGAASAEIATLLAEAAAGEVGAVQRLTERLQPLLRAMLIERLAEGSPATMADAGALVQVLWQRLAGAKGKRASKAAQAAARALYPVFVEPAAQVMQSLVDALVARAGHAGEGAGAAMAALAALQTLGALEPQLARVVRLRWHGGLELAEIGALPGHSAHDLERDWNKALAFISAAARHAPSNADAWMRLSILYDTGRELPPELHEGWLTSLRGEEPHLVEWLRAMLADAQGGASGEALERGPYLPAWIAEAPAPPSPATATASAPAAPDASRATDAALAAFMAVLPSSRPVQAAATGATARAASAEPGEAAETIEAAEPTPSCNPVVPVATTAPTIGSDTETAAPHDPSSPRDRMPGEPASEPSAQSASGALTAPGADAVPDPAPDIESHEGASADPAGSLTPAAPAPPRIAAPPLASGMRLGPWRLMSPMPSSDARVLQWRARRADETAAGREFTLQVPHQWRPRTDLAAWLDHVAARPMALVHPHIARLAQVGVADDGTPWLAAELAEGQPIDRWCRDHPLELHERRDRIEQVVEAAAHAHAHRVVHGRIHPSQVIVTPDRQVHWLNFGLHEVLALLDTPLAAATQGTGAPPAGAYAAPEHRRAHGEQGPADVSGDVHALGLIAFEVLSGASPWQVRPAGKAAHNAPDSPWPRPSDVAGTSRLRRALRGDLDAIVAKATHAERVQRYSALAALLDDLQRAREHRPVGAADRGFLYPFACLARRHPRRASALAVLGILFTSLFAGLAWNAWTWTGERDQAQAVQRSSEAVSQLLQDLLRNGAHSSAELDWPAVLAQAETLARASLKEQPSSLASALALLGRHHVERGAFAEGRNLLAEALPLLASRVEQLEADCDEAWAQARQGDRVEEAEQRLRRVTEKVTVRPVTRVLCMARLADLERRSGRRLDAYQTTYEAWQTWEASPERPPRLALALARPMGLQSVALGRFHESQLWFEWALKQAALLQQDKAAVGIELREQWGEVSLAAGDAERAIQLADANLAALTGDAPAADDDAAAAPPAAQVLAAAEPRLELQRLDEARPRLEKVVALADARGDNPLRQRARCLLAQAALREGDAAGAMRWLKAVPADAAAANVSESTGANSAGPAGAIAGAPLLDLERELARQAARGAEHFCRLVNAELGLQQGRATEAYREADRLVNSSGGLASRLAAAATLLRAEALMAARQHDRALSAALQALQQARALHQSDIEDQKARPSFRSGQAALVLTEAHRANGDIEAASQTLDYALQQLSATLPETHPWRRRAEATKAALDVHAQKKP